MSRSQWRWTDETEIVHSCPVYYPAMSKLYITVTKYLVQTMNVKQQEHLFTFIFGCCGPYLLFIPACCSARARHLSEVCVQHSLHVVQNGALLHLHRAVCRPVVHHQLTLLARVLAHQCQQQRHLRNLAETGV